MEHILKKLRKASVKREKYWNPGNSEIPKGFRALEVAGEVGELANAIKKLWRFQLGLVGGTNDQENLKEEIGDVLISLDLLARSYDIDLWSCVVDKFNKTSDKHSFPVKIDSNGDIIPVKKKNIYTSTKDKNNKLVLKKNGKIWAKQG